jgi:hypothetical protein
MRDEAAERCSVRKQNREVVQSEQSTPWNCPGAAFLDELEENAIISMSAKPGNIARA